LLISMSAARQWGGFAEICPDNGAWAWKGECE
jgi:hypothetical protein